MNNKTDLTMMEPITNEQLDNVLEKFKEKDIQFVRWEQTDMYGVARSKTVPTVHFREKATGGLPFYLGHIGMDPQANIAPGTGYNEEVDFADGLMFPDLDTVIDIPWCKNTGRVLIEPTYQGKPVLAHPRVLARKQLAILKELGYTLLSAHEHEFFVVDKDTLKPYTEGINIRSTLRNYKDPELVHQILTDLPKVGVNVEALESEYAPGQLEISYKPAFGIKSGDIAHTYRTSLKEIALQHGYIASFMSKPWPDRSGSSCHFNHSLWDVNGTKGMMHDANRPHGLSEIAEYWIAGIMAHAPAISLLMAPTVNCLKRYKPNSFAPSNVTWGIDNRSCALRIQVKGERGTYIENRMGAAGCNPYIAIAATVAAGMDGIRCQMKLPPIVKGNAYDPKNTPPKTATLPNDMETALGYFANDAVIREALGEDFCRCFGALKLHEVRLQQEAKTKGNDNWEQELFFEYL